MTTTTKTTDRWEIGMNAPKTVELTVEEIEIVAGRMATYRDEISKLALNPNGKHHAEYLAKRAERVDDIMRRLTVGYGRTIFATYSDD